MIKSLSKPKKQVILLYCTTLLGLIMGVLASIINTRFLSPEDYGNVRYVQNIINFISSLLLFGYFLSGSRLLALSNDEQKSRTIRGAMVIVLAIASVVLIFSMLGCYFIHFNANRELARLFIISIPVCFYPIFLNYINTVSQGDNHIGRISIARLVPMAIYVPIAYLTYKNYGASSTLMILLQWGLYTLVTFVVILSSKPKISNVRNVFKELNKENKEYGFKLYTGSLVMVATNYIAGITLGMFNNDNSEVGFYTLALTITSPLATLPAIIGTTYFKQFATQDKIPNKVMKTSIILSVSSCVVFILLIKPLITFLYDDAYSVVGTYAMWLAAGYSVHGFGDMINRYLGSHGQGNSIRNSSIANGIFKIIGYTIFVYCFGTKGALGTHVLCSFVYCIVLLYYYLSFVNSKK